MVLIKSFVQHVDFINIYIYIYIYIYILIVVWNKYSNMWKFLFFIFQI